MKAKNIIWICTDQQRFDTLGCYGNKFVNTPNLDRLALNGVMFKNSYCQSPACAPSRSSFLTGRYPRTTRVRQNGQLIPQEERLVTKILADNGYTCGLAGKLHISPCYQRNYERRSNDDGYTVFHWSQNSRPDVPTNEYIHWLLEKGIRYQTSPFPDSQYIKIGMPAEYHQTTWCVQKAINFIKAHANTDKPWLFSVNMSSPHHPFIVPSKYLQRYLDKLNQIPLPCYLEGELEDKPITQKIGHLKPYNIPDIYPFPKMSDQDHRFIRAAYLGMIDLIDAQVGRIFDVLKRTQQLKNTVIIFMSDHGEMLGDHGLYLKGPYFYEPTIRVPLIFSCPNFIKEGVRSDALIELVDIAPTLLDIVGIDRYPGMQGKSFWPLLIGSSNSNYHRDDIYCEYYNTNFQKSYSTMLRTDKYKLVAIHGLDSGELYDLKNDPNEKCNLWNNTKYNCVKLKMLKRLCDRMAWTVDPLPLRQAIW